MQHLGAVIVRLRQTAIIIRSYWALIIVIGVGTPWCAVAVVGNLCFSQPPLIRSVHGLLQYSRRFVTSICYKRHSLLSSTWRHTSIRWRNKSKSVISFTGWSNLYTALRKNGGIAWVWPTGGVIQYDSVWLPGEPATGGSYCAITSNSSDGSFGLKVISGCDRQHMFVCEKENCITN